MNSFLVYFIYMSYPRILIGLLLFLILSSTPPDRMFSTLAPATETRATVLSKEETKAELGRIFEEGRVLFYQNTVEKTFDLLLQDILATDELIPHLYAQVSLILFNNLNHCIKS